MALAMAALSFGAFFAGASPNVIPFSVSSTPLRPVSHMGGFLIRAVPVFDIREIAGPANQMLVNTPQLGAGLAKKLGDSAVVLIRGHGDAVAGASVKHAVMHAIYAEFNARIQSEAIHLGQVTYLNEQEAASIAAANDDSVDRPWEIWEQRVLGGNTR